MKFLRVLRYSAFLSAVALSFAGTASAQCDVNRLMPGLNENCSITVDGRARTFDVLVPSNLQRGMKTALIEDLHGFGGTNKGQRASSGLARLANENKAMLIYPQGLNNSWDGMGRCCGDSLTQMVDDVNFLRTLMQRVMESTGVDKTSLKAVSGISNGMAMTNRLACDAGDFFDLAAGVSFQLNANLAPVCQKAGSGTIYAEFHGTADTVVPFGGTLLQTGKADEVPRNLAQIRGCSLTPKQSRLNSATTCQTFDGCTGGGFVQMCTVQDGQHGLYRFIRDPDFSVAFERLMDQAIQVNRANARTGDLPLPMSMAPVAPAPVPPTSAPRQ